MFAALSNLFRREANQPLQGPAIDDPVAAICTFLSGFLAMSGVGPDSRLVEDFALDSFGVQDVLAFLEVRFGKRVDPSLLCMADFATPRAIAELLHR